MDPDHGVRQSVEFLVGQQPLQLLPDFAGARRPDVVGEPSLDMSKWDNGGPDRFTLQNRPAVIDQQAHSLGRAAAAT